MVFVPINNLLKKGELLQIIRYIEPRFMLMDSDFEELMHSTTAGMDFIEFKISLNASPASPFISYEDLLRKEASRNRGVEIAGR